MSKIFTTFMALIMLCASMTCSAANASRTVDVKNTFTAISVDDNITLNYTVGIIEPVKIVAPAAVIDRVKVTVDDRTLKISIADDANSRNVEGVKVFVKAPQVCTFEVEDNAEIRCQTPVAAECLTIKVKDNGSFRAPAVNGDKLVVEIKDNGEVRIADSVLTDNLKIETSDNSEFSASLISANSGKFEASENSSITVKNLNLAKGEVETSDNAVARLQGKCAMMKFSASNNSNIRADELQVNAGDADASENASIRVNVADLNSKIDGKAQIVNKAK